MTEKHEDVEVAPDVTFNGLWYTVTAPSGETWSMEPIEDENIPYIDSALYCWSRWRDFVEAKNDRSTKS